MLSLDLAKKLKMHNFRPKQYRDIALYWFADTKAPMYVHVDCYASEPDAVWLPPLDQLLAGIEQRGYGYSLRCSSKYDLHYKYPDQKWALYLRYKWGDVVEVFYSSETPEDAAALALIYILEREKEVSKNDQP